MSVPELKIREVVATTVEPLLNGCFPVPAGGSFFDDFPIWKKAGGVTWLALCDDDGRAFACAGMVDGRWMLNAEHADVPVARIGGVACLPDFRGRGAAGRLVEALLNRASERKLQAAVLWGQESPLYTRLGFRSAGRQIRAPLSALVSAIDRMPAFLRLEFGARGELLPLLERSRVRHGGIHLSALDGEDWLFAHRNTRWVHVWNATDELVGYGAFGRGMDLTMQLHEWGGSREAVRMVARWALTQNSNAEVMGKQETLEDVFGSLPGESIVEPSSLIKVLDSPFEAVLHRHQDEAWFWGLDGV